ncbi:LysR family transcriptional regulator [Sulfurospirillum arcachonense]|uniref:LysR family transcriptional regulator n=1 Tax=Sulfurospirillum arcachonense TaxID=57666 RepID=UPI00046AE39C|nr:LysR family transcriptional regulator [Sulfurospirillum arcachonense]
MLRDFTKIETFLTVVKEKSFSKASKKLGISQPAVTQQIKILEDYLDARIVDRKKNGIKLTKIGEEFFKIVTKLDKSIVQAEKDIIKIINKELVFIIGASYIIGNYILPDFLTEIQHAIDNEVLIKVANSDSITEELLDKKVDLALLESPIFQDGIIYREWMEDELVLVSKTPLPKIVKPEDLNSFRWICREEESHTRQIIKAELEKVGVECNSFDLRSVVTSSTAVKQTILKSPEIDGFNTVSIISKHMINDEIAREELFYARIKGVKLSRKLYLAYSKERKQDAFMDRVINYIISKRRV